MSEGLFEQDTDTFIITWNRLIVRHGPGTIRKKDGTILGYIKAGGMINRYICILDIHHKTIIKSNKNKIHSYQYAVKDSAGNKIGTVYGKTAFSVKNDMKMKDEKGNKILEIKTNEKNQYEIYTHDGKLIAKDIAVSIKNSTDDASEFTILDLNYDRQRLWGLYISFLSGFSDKSTVVPD